MPVAPLGRAVARARTGWRRGGVMVGGRREAVGGCLRRGCGGGGPASGLIGGERDGGFEEEIGVG